MKPVEEQGLTTNRLLKRLQMLIKNEQGSAFMELILSTVILGMFYVVMISVGSIMVYSTAMKVNNLLSAQAALTAYDRNNFAEVDTGAKSRPVNAAIDAAELNGKQLFSGAASGSLLINGQTTKALNEDTKSCIRNGVDYKGKGYTQSVDSSNIQQEGEYLKIVIPAGSKWIWGQANFCITNQAEIWGAANG